MLVMDQVKYVRHERLSLKGHATLNERWVHDRLAEDPALLGLGSLVLKDRERIQPRAGRLDLLFQDQNSERRYEVEVQLGATDESHIIRTLEYWDIERNRYPNYDHTAVLVAEDVTTRFLNVIGLLNKSIPLVAIQMNALLIDSKVSLLFTTVLDTQARGSEEDEEPASADRAYWESERSTKETLTIVDDLFGLLKTQAPAAELKYNKFYIGIHENGQPNNFVIFRPRGQYVRVEPRLKESQEIQAMLEKSGLDVMDYDSRWGRYRIRVTRQDLSKHKEVILKLFTMSKGGQQK